MKFSAMLLFMMLWSLVVYVPMAHMVWGKGGLLNAFSGGKIPCLDFAGGTVVHITSGVSALVCALYLGKRVGYPTRRCRRTAVVLSFIGACLLWVGWFGFNAGSALVFRRAGHQRLRGHAFRRGRGGDRWMRRRMDSQRQAQRAGRHLRSGRGTGCDHAGVGFRAADAALLIGLIAGVFCYMMVAVVKQRFGYDDSLDAFGVHGVGRHAGRDADRRLRHQRHQSRVKDAAGKRCRWA